MPSPTYLYEAGFDTEFLLQCAAIMSIRCGLPIHFYGKHWQEILVTEGDMSFFLPGCHQIGQNRIALLSGTLLSSQCRREEPQYVGFYYQARVEGKNPITLDFMIQLEQKGTTPICWDLLDCQSKKSKKRSRTPICWILLSNCSYISSICTEVCQSSKTY